MGKRHQVLGEGTRFGDLSIVRIAPSAFSKRGDEVFRYWVSCSCGTVKEIALRNLTKGHSRSCGCKRSEAISAKNTKHGMSRSKTYAVWDAMIQRCTNSKSRAFPRYGGRGIEVCEEWLDFRLFLRDMGEQPNGLSLERRENSGNYEPGNCCWATMGEQLRNTRRTQLVDLRGKQVCVTDAARSLSIDPSTIWTRVRRNRTSLQAAVDHYVAKSGR